MILSHFLIGVPGSGKSTFSQELAKLGNYQIVSSDRIRVKLYGAETILGNWLEIETEIIKQIEQNINSGIGIIYDATNAHRAWRLDFLQKIETKLGKQIEWLGWYLQLDLNTCKQWNSQRLRQVPEEIIEKMANYLVQFPPHVAEGFIDIKLLKNSEELTINNINKKLNNLERSIINRINRTCHSNAIYHAYSKLVDFERLMHLISLIIQYPDLGNLEFNYPDILQEIFAETLSFPDSLAEITTIMAKLKGKVYANRELIAQDLNFLQNCLIYSQDLHNQNQVKQIKVAQVEYDNLITHYASEKHTFERILNTIKTIAEYPFIPKLDEDYLKDKSIPNGYLTSLAFKLIERENLSEFELKSRRDLLRKDIEFIFNPYQIFLRGNHMRNGYYLGTGILTQTELKQVFSLLKAEAKNIEDPVALEMSQKLQDRIKWSNLSDDYVYPVRAIANRSFIDNNLLDSRALSQKEKREQIAEIIEKRQLVRLGKFGNRPSYEEETNGLFDAWLLQITFYNFAWYLGFEDGNGLFRFERLDRLFLDTELTQTRTINQQKKALDKLTKLLDASTGIYLGNDVKAQQAFLSQEKQQRKTVETKIELWFSEKIFAFVAEGTKRFPTGQMKMSKPPRSVYHSSNSKSLFSLGLSEDKMRPYRFQVTLPKWSLDEFDFLRWILGFGGDVKIHKPIELRDRIIKLSVNTLNVYREIKE